MDIANVDKPKSASNVQKEELVRIFEEYQQKMKLENLDDSKERTKFWTDAAQRLNKIEGGTVKPISKWVKYWADVIINLRRKSRLVMEGRSRRIGPTQLEVRILRVSNCYDVLENWTKSVDGTTELGIAPVEEYYPEDTGVQKEEIVVENYNEDQLVDEEYVSFTKSDMDGTAQTVTTELHIRKASTEELKPAQHHPTTEYSIELSAVNSLTSATSEFLRPKPPIVAEVRLKENLKRNTEKLETVMKKRKIDDSKYAIAQALTNMSSAILALSNGVSDLAQALMNDSSSSGSGSGLQESVL
ncbi:uncharacterized protein LOC131206082 isoform X1 [Anopheles bellator]|uniref:uncharacterized protein LOC131206082 isoform X1 n=2 Tax=Anopheles bellator TaxID=139047 RepID=UPI002648A640|nr:uncharacterized protein LOC131206082 isoform X1 [Anopheles bellator]